MLSDCAVCTEGYGRGVTNSCHFCNDTTAHVLFAMGTLFTLVVILLLLLAAVFLIGGLDAIDIVRQSVHRKIPFGSNSSAGGISVPKTSLRSKSGSFASTNPFTSSVAPAFALESEIIRGGGDRGAGRGKVFPTNYSEEPDYYDQAFARPLGAVVGVELSDMSGNSVARDRGVSSGRRARFSADTTGGVGGRRTNNITDDEDASDDERPLCCGFGDKVKRWLSRLPLDKLKILVVVWQILTVFSGITGVEYPATYSRFLSWINVVNLDIGNIFSASCILPSANFYARVLVTTISPLVLAAVLVLTYKMAKRRAGIGRAGVIARRAAWSRHVAAGLLLTFLVSSDFFVYRIGQFGRARGHFDGTAKLLEAAHAWTPRFGRVGMCLFAACCLISGIHVLGVFLESQSFRSKSRQHFGYLVIRFYNDVVNVFCANVPRKCENALAAEICFLLWLRCRSPRKPLPPQCVAV